MRLIDRKRLKDGGAYSQNYKKHSRGNMPSEKISRELSFKIAEYPLHQLLRLGRQEIHIAPSNPMSESSLRDYVLPSSVYPYFELDNEQ